MDANIIIKINDGRFFEGTPEMFLDCFLDAPCGGYVDADNLLNSETETFTSLTEEQVIHWAKSQGCNKIEFIKNVHLS